MDKITNNIVKQALHLNKNLAFINNKLEKIFILSALILVSVTFEGNQKLFQTLNLSILIGISMVLNMIVAGLFGILVPVSLKKNQ